MEKHIKEGIKEGKDVVEVYCNTHRKEDCNTLPSMVQEKMDNYRAMLPPPTTPVRDDSVSLDPSDTQSRTSNAHVPPFNLDVWLKATGGIKKGKVMGYEKFLTAKRLLATPPSFMSTISSMDLQLQLHPQLFQRLWNKSYHNCGQRSVPCMPDWMHSHPNWKHNHPN